MAEERTVLLKLEVDKDKAQQNLEANAAQIEINKKELKDLNKEYKDGNVSVQEYSKRKLQLTNANKELGKENRQLLKQLDTEENSLNALRQQLSKLTAERNNTNQATEEGRKAFDRLQKEIKDTTDAIKEQEEAGGDFRRNVGNYFSALVGATGALGDFTKGIKDSATAFLTNPIGILVAALTGLIALFKKSQAGIDIFKRGFNVINSVVNTVADNLGELASIIGDVLTLNFASATQKAKEFGNQLVENAKETDQLTLATQRLERQIIKNQALNAKALSDEEQLKNIRDNELNSLEDRIAANEELFVIEQKRFDRNIAIAEEQLRIAKAESNNRKDNVEALQAVADAETRLFELREERAGRENEFITNRTGLIREQSEDELALLEARTQERLILAEEGSREELNLRLRLLRERQALELQAVGENANRRKEIIQRSLNEELQLYKDYQANIQQVQRISNNEQEQGVKIVNKEIRSVDLQTTQAKIKNIEDEIEAEKLKNEITLMSTAQLSGTLAGLFEENTTAYKTFASIEASISTFLAINKTLGAYASVPIPGFAIAQAAAIGIQGFANVAKINGLIGGGSGANSGESAQTSQPRITRTSLSGAFDRNTLTSDTNNQADQTNQITSTLRNQPAPIVRVTDINKKQKNKRQVTVGSTL